MTGNLEQPKRTGASAAWPEASTSLVQADDILTPEELARLSVSLCSPVLCFAEFAPVVQAGLAQPGLKVPDSWVYEKTRGRCRNPIPCLRLGRYVRFRRVPLLLPHSGNMANRPRAIGHKSGKTGFPGPPQSDSPAPIKTDLKQTERMAFKCACPLCPL